jgi:protein O-mannosyl-transferase
MQDPAVTRTDRARPRGATGHAHGAAGRTAAVVAGVLLMGLTVLIYFPALRAGFVWDDAEYVTDNPTLHSLDGLRRIWLEPSALPQYYPLTLTTFWIEHHLWELRPFGYHFDNILLHALTALLLWVVLRRLRVPGAWVAAAIFALHPIQVESVAWITERKNVLSGLFTLAALLAFLRGTGLDRPRQPVTIDRRWYAGACVLCAAGLLSKTTACALPPVLLLLVWWKRGSIDRRAVWLTTPFFVLGALMAAATMVVEGHYVAGAEWSRPLVERGLVAGRAFWFYPYTLIWPRTLAFIYPRWSIEPQVWWQSLFPAGVAAVTVGLYLGRRHLGRGPLVAVLCYAVALVPVSGFFNIYFMRYAFVADRFAYLPSIPLIVLATTTFAKLAARAGRGGPPIALLTATVVVVALAGLTIRRCGIYETPRALWADTVAKNPDSWLAHNNLGVLLERAGDTDAAVTQYTAAVRLQPAYPETYLNLGNVLRSQGKLEEAATLYGVALRLQPAYPMAHLNLGLTLAAQGKMEDAVREYRDAVRQSPEFPEANNSLGAALQVQGDLAAAAAAYAAALRLRPGYAEAHYNLATVLAATGQLDDAVTHYAAAVRLRPEYPDARVNLGNLLTASGKRDQAVAEYEAAVRLQPAHAEAHNSLGVALAEQGRIQEARDHFEQAVRAKPDYPEAHSNLGNTLQALGALDDAIAQYEAALRLRPTYAEARNNLGMALAAQGKTDAAIAQFEQAVQANPDMVPPRNNLANALLAAGRYAEAVEQYESVLRLQPTDAAARRQLEAARSAQRRQN